MPSFLPLDDSFAALPFYCRILWGGCIWYRLYGNRPGAANQDVEDMASWVLAGYSSEANNTMRPKSTVQFMNLDGTHDSTIMLLGHIKKQFEY